MATDRPGTRDPAPEGSKRSGERQADGYFARARNDGGESRRQGKIAGGRRCQDDRGAAGADPGQTSPSQDDRTDLPKTDTRERTPRDNTTPPTRPGCHRAEPPSSLPRFLGPQPKRECALHAPRAASSSPAHNPPRSCPPSRADIRFHAVCRVVHHPENGEARNCHHPNPPRANQPQNARHREGRRSGPKPRSRDGRTHLPWRRGPTIARVAPVPSGHRLWPAGGSRSLPATNPHL